jgi:hypothetical protein
MGPSRNAQKASAVAFEQGLRLPLSPGPWLPSPTLAHLTEWWVDNNCIIPQLTHPPTHPTNPHLPNWCVDSSQRESLGSSCCTVTDLIQGIHCGMRSRSSHSAQHTSSGTGTSTSALGGLVVEGTREGGGLMRKDGDAWGRR